MRACVAPISTRRTSCAPRSSPIPAFTRRNTKDNTPSVLHLEMVPGSTVSVDVAAKGGGSENKSKFKMMNPSDLDPRLGAGDDPADGRRLVPAGHARHRHRRHGGKGHAAGQGKPDGADRHGAAQAARAPQRYRDAAHPDFRRGQRARHRRAGAGRAFDHPRREDLRLADPCRVEAGGDDPQLRGDPPCAFHARRVGPGLSGSAEARRMAGRRTGRPTRRRSGSISTR